MSKKRLFDLSGIAAVLALGVLVAFAPAVFAEGEVTVDLAGDMVPGETVTATLVINDESTFESASWMQTAGAAAVLSGADSQVLTATLAALPYYKDELFHHLTEPPITEDQLPPNVELPEGEFPGGLPARWGVAGVNPFAIEEAALVVFDATVVTSSGTYHVEAEVHTTLPWKPAAGIRTVPIGIPVLLNGKDQTTYDWALSAPSGSSASLMDATTQYPDFVPDVAGMYGVTVTDEATTAPTTINVYAGTWEGIITGKDENDRPTVQTSCNACHGETVADWTQTGHAEIFSANIDTSTHYGENCFPCHTVGFDKDAANGGFDDATDYQAFVDAGLINNPGDNWTTVLDQYPDVAKKANIQCENCHGPQNSDAHMDGTARQNLSSDICATCHGEPLRHARFQQWQLSGHANYELAIDESQSGNCSRCHTGNGFLEWLPVLTGEADGDPADSVTVTWTADESHPQTCVVCHDPHAIGSNTGVGTDASMRIEDDTPPLLAGFTATDVGRGAICMTCHNTRRGLRNDSNWDEVGAEDPVRAPHSGAQADVMMGQNAYFVNVGDRSYHADVGDSCATCHMENTPPPDVLAYNLGGTNHTFFAQADICGDCHDVAMAADVQTPVMDAMHDLEELIEAEWMKIVASQLAAGNSIDLAGDGTITDIADVAEIILGESHGRQGFGVEFTDGTVVEPHRLNDITVVPPMGDAVDIYLYAPDDLLKAGWNYFLIHSDGSYGVHNPTWSQRVLAHTISVVENGSIGGGGDATGPGVACTSEYVYWAEIAAHAPGDFESVWRTDVVALNPNAVDANLQFILHRAGGNMTVNASVPAMSQGVFEDVVDLFGVDAVGSLEICSTTPLEVVARIFSENDEGSLGQFLDGLTNLGGMAEGDTALLLGLRQMTDEFRTNISVTNTGMVEAEVDVTLYESDGTELTTFTITVGPGMVVQDTSSFADWANKPNLGWGYAEVEVVTGSGILCSASVIDSRTNDPTTIPMKR